MTELKQDNSRADNAPEAPREASRGKSRARTTGRTTEKQELIRLLGKKTGADIVRLCEKLGRQPSVASQSRQLP